MPGEGGGLVEVRTRLRRGHVCIDRGEEVEAELALVEVVLVDAAHAHFLLIVRKAERGILDAQHGLLPGEAQRIPLRDLEGSGKAEEQLLLIDPGCLASPEAAYIDWLCGRARSGAVEPRAARRSRGSRRAVCDRRSRSRERQTPAQSGEQHHAAAHQAALQSSEGHFQATRGSMRRTREPTGERYARYGNGGASDALSTSHARMFMQAVSGSVSVPRALSSAQRSGLANVGYNVDSE
eukprot:scaffold3870_cov246-Pinguiococcus_pyrenoidosus.AAC.9